MLATPLANGRYQLGLDERAAETIPTSAGAELATKLDPRGEMARTAAMIDFLGFVRDWPPICLGQFRDERNAGRFPTPGYMHGQQ